MTTFTLRDIPEELYQKIKDMAARERRSVNQQILVLLERSVRLSQGPPVDVLKGAIQMRSQVR
ncbi:MULTISPECIES: FitA-like ribbon-helix-helix domain-containing protein [Moorena]|uniref:FitA-like ribbon-helix-helix domain-containing protein n=1 Tax=Moorena TaxID=1155738 RepID=UPI0014295EDF|nr:Arc family DNA-binding protein [Moorena sp. SIO4G3]NEO77305.1 Arc family DNA-binding protein [Moorena sp. SIO4G3]